MTPLDPGDEHLASRTGELLGSRHPVFAVATVSGSAVSVASRGAGLDADFEIASISKGLTGLLYADACDRHEISPESTLGDLLPLGDVPAAGVTLGSLSTHRSGLPSVPRSAQPLRRTIALWRHGSNPYGESREELLAHARGVRLGSPRTRYSNVGFALLGHAIAGAAGMAFVDVVRSRLTRPLGLEHLYLPATVDELRPAAVTGRSRRGAAREPWTGEAWAPAGGVRASILDMARLTAALLDTSTPGVAALDPVAPLGSRTQIGAGWVVTEVDGRTITWHNGGSGGFRSWLGVDRAAATGVVILSATAASVDRPGFALLAEITRAKVP